MGKHKHKNRDRSRSRSISRDKKSTHKHSKKHKRHRSESKSPERPSTSNHSISYEEMASKKKKMKELAKLVETPEEKLRRRMEKKMNKDRKRRNKSGWNDEYLGYSNTDNPFGDDKLLQTFMWNKKLQKEGRGILTRGEFEKEQISKMAASKIELEKVKQRRLEREKEREDFENDKEMMQRSKESEYFKTWEQQEDKFHLDQAKLRSKIRINDGRAKPIDLLAHYIRNEHDNDSSLDLHEPYSYLNGLTATDLEDLKEDIVVYMNMDVSAGSDNTSYWNDISTIANNEIRKIRSSDESGERRQAVNAAVKDDVNSIFKGKTIPQLEKLHSSIEDKLSNSKNLDLGYWESLQQQLLAHIAMLRLKNLHEDILLRKLKLLKAAQGVTTSTTSSSLASRPSTSQTKDANEHSEVPIDYQHEDDMTSSEFMADQSTNDVNVDSTIYDESLYEPKLLTKSQIPEGTIIYDLESDYNRLLFSREQVEKNGNITASNDDQLVKKAMDGMNNDEAQFSVEMPIQQNLMLWSDKYRPRKPRFFNRVHTGFEWNKYNQTHYDVDNPPPKVVQGYKFNIFYPDLIDKSKAPEFTLTLLKKEPDFACLKFSSGPPYEAIAFKVVHREWECGYKRGFRCQFQNNVFQLWYHFKRYRYRR